MEISKVEKDMNDEKVLVIVSEYQEDAFIVQLWIDDRAKAPLTPHAARLIARHLLEGADVAEDNENAMRTDD